MDYHSFLYPQNQTAELHLSRFANGIRGNSIKYKDEWMTPQDFENACGTSNNKYLENIQTDYGPLKTLTASGRLKPHSRKCRCSVCRGEETSPKTDKLKAKKRPKNLEEEGKFAIRSNVAFQVVFILVIRVNLTFSHLYLPHWLIGFFAFFFF